MALIMQIPTKKTPPVVEVMPPVPVPVVAPKVVTHPPVSEVEALTTEYIELYRKFEYFEVKTLVKRMEEIRKTLHAVANETMDAKKPALFSSPEGDVEFSERGKTTEVLDPLAVVQVLLEKFGPEVTASVVDIAITPLRKVLSEFELKKYLKETPGGRTLRSVRPVG